MDIEQRQAELIEYFVNRAGTSEGSSLGGLIVEATSHSSLFAFSEILSVPSVAELQGTEHSVYLDLLRLFAYGTLSDYKSRASCFPPLLPDQIRKLKQLTVLTLAETDKGIVRGKLDQLRRCFEVQFAAGRDLRPEQLGSMIQTLETWKLEGYRNTFRPLVTFLRELEPRIRLGTSDNLLLSIQEKIKWADTMGEINNKHRKEVEDRLEELKSSLPLKVKVTHFKQADNEFRGHEDFHCSESSGLMMEYEEDRARQKSIPASLTIYAI
ncbi:hypothetical protein Syun_018539 [Stephania yunnanensis]|uniref:COP9 signalosome complex subunit 7 n=1 Tax=Stephania yunnanensis TaxID=152371 RepID=A0AAP0NV42_9MAGN